MSAPSVSIVINTYNRAKQLESALRALTVLDYHAFEVVVVNGPSVDATERILKAYHGAIKLGNCDVANLSKSRNIGISLASGDIVAFLDDDAVPHPSWLQNLTRPYLDPEVGAVGGFTIDHTGVRWQVKKTICDRYGHAYYASEFFDERTLNRIGSYYYPSVLGANSSFRASYLRDIGGFDESFAYFLDETDVCIRIVDAGRKVLYEPSAVVYHQSAPSDLRSAEKIPTTLRPSVVSKSYFIMRHGAPCCLSEALSRLDRYHEELLNANRWLAENGRISWDHRAALDKDVVDGIKIGSRLARERSNQTGGHLKHGSPPEFMRFEAEATTGLRIALVSRALPPLIDAGIARWTQMLAVGLAKRGHEIHIITEATADESVEYVDGIWTHRVSIQGPAANLAIRYNLPSNIASWAGRVAQEVQFIKSFGLDVVSFPIWDLEGVSMIDDPSIGCVLSLHTSYALAKPFKAEWNTQPIYEHEMVNRMIAGERTALRNAPVIVANSHAIVEDMQAVYDLDFSDRVLYAPHGTLDLLEGAAIVDSRKGSQRSTPLRVLFVGRFEPRKGFDIAVDVSRLLRSANKAVHLTFVGGTTKEIERCFPAEYARLVGDPLIQFEGQVSRKQLDQLYRDADVVLMPSRYESFGLVAIEGMSAGKPVIGLRAGGLKEIIVDQQNGYLVDDDENAAQKCYEHIVALAENRPLLAKLSRRARADFVEKYTVDAMAEAVEKAYLVAAKASI